MITEQEILSALDNFGFGPYCQFVYMGNVYSYLIDSRLNVFRSDDDKWAIAIERLGYSPRGSGIQLEIYYFGNCLVNLEHYNGYDINYYHVESPIDWDSFVETINIESLQPDARYWVIRGEQVVLSHNKQDYINADIDMRGYEPDTIAPEAVGRWLITNSGTRNLLRATDEELYKSIPGDLKKILVIDEWHHRDFFEFMEPSIHMSDEQLRNTYEFNKNLVGGEYPFDYETFAALIWQQEQSNDQFNQLQKQDNSPGSYETWQLIAKVIATGDTAFYRPTLKPNSHWKNWPDSGSM